MTAGQTAPARRPAGRAAGGRLLPHPRRSLRHHAARRPRRRGGQGRGPRRRRHPHLAAAGPRRRRRPTTWASTATSGRSPWTSRTPTTPPLAQELARRADVMIENFKPGGLARFGLDYDAVARDQPRRRLRLDQRLRHAAPGAGAARLRPDRAGHLRADEPDRRHRTGQPYRAGISVFDVMAGLHATIGILAALHHRARDRARASTSRSTCCPRRCRGWSTRPARTWPAASCRTGWATATRACSRTSRCPAPTAS